MSATRYNFTIEQGADFKTVVTWKDQSGALVNVTGYTARMKLKTLDGTLILSLTNVSNANGDQLQLGGSAGTITIFISNATTNTLTFTEALYDLELVDGAGVVTRLIEGHVDLDKQVTD